MMKKLILLLLLTGMIFICLPAAQARDLSRAEIYQALQDELQHYLDGDDAMPIEDLTEQFTALIPYKKSAAFSYYTAILRDVEAGEYINLPLYTELLRLDEDFCTLLADEENPLPSVDEIEAYALGRQAEAAGERLTAIAYYRTSISVLDSMTRLAALLLSDASATPPPATPRPTRTPGYTPAKPTYTPAPASTPEPFIPEETAAPTPEPFIPEETTAPTPEPFVPEETAAPTPEPFIPEETTAPTPEPFIPEEEEELPNLEFAPNPTELPTVG